MPPTNTQLALIIHILLVLLGSSSLAYMRGEQATSQSSSTASHVIIVGRGSDMGTQFRSVGLAKMKKLIEQDPSRSILWLSAIENGPSSDRALLGKYGLSVSQADDSDLTSDVIIKEISKLSQVASIHIIGHNAPHYGTLLEGSSVRINWNDSGLSELKTKLSDDSYVVLHGCNTGFYFAPKLSELWKVPVFGSLTSTAFQRLHSNGKFYVNDPGQYPDGAWAPQNAVSYQADAWECPHGECLRLKPDWIPYSGKWGDFSYGLGHFQGFCIGVPETRCLRGFYLNAIHQVSEIKAPLASQNLNQFRLVLTDMFCPNDKSGAKTEACRAQLALAESQNDSYFHAFVGGLLQCTTDGCAFQLKCNKFFGKILPKCHLNPASNGKATTVVDEYRRYLKAFEQNAPKQQ